MLKISPNPITNACIWAGLVLPALGMIEGCTPQHTPPSPTPIPTQTSLPKPTSTPLPSEFKGKSPEQIAKLFATRNTHLVMATGKGDQRHIFLRSAAPTLEAINQLEQIAIETGKPVTVFDLRKPVLSHMFWTDDNSGNDYRLRPGTTPDPKVPRKKIVHETECEGAVLRKKGITYVYTYAEDPTLPEQIDQAFAMGHVGIHCQHGVNRTATALARWWFYRHKNNRPMKFSKKGFRDNNGDWNYGVALQQNRK